MKSRYCQECLKFRQKKCKGEEQPKETVLYFGGQRTGMRLRAGLNFCQQYEFDIRFYKFPDGSKETQPETIKEIRKRQIEKEIEEIQQQLNEATYNIVDVGKNLSSSDFADLLI